MNEERKRKGKFAWEDGGGVSDKCKFLFNVLEEFQVEEAVRNGDKEKKNYENESSTSG